MAFFSGLISHARSCAPGFPPHLSIPQPSIDTLDIHPSLPHLRGPPSMDRTSTVQQKPHVVMFGFAAQGHIVPFMHLAKKLAIRGFVVTFVNTEHCISRMQQSKRKEDNSGSNQQQFLDIRLVGLPDGLPEDHSRDIQDPEVLDAIDKMGGVFGQLVGNLMKGEPPVSCLIMDTFLPFSRDVANQFSLPRVLFWTTSVSIFCIHLHTDLLLSLGILPLKTERNELIDCIPGVRPFRLSQLPSAMQLETSHRRFKYFHRQFKNIHEADWVFVNSFYELESRAVDTLRANNYNVLTVGPLLPPPFLQGKSTFQAEIGASLWAEEDICLQWLDQQAPCSVLYVSFGSIAKLTPDLFQKFASGLQASKQPFLWVVRRNQVHEESFDFLEEFRTNTEQQGLIIPWAPQLSVLSHASTGGFLTHCGWNSVLESMSAGVPMICWPQAYDQLPVCRLVVEDFNVGMELQIGDCNKPLERHIAEVVRAMMQGNQGKDLREKAMEIRDAARMAVARGGSSENNLQAFAESMKR